MGAFTVKQVENAINSALDFHFKKGMVDSQSIQNKPLLKKLMGKVKTFPGGKETITKRVKFDYTTGIQGFVNDDTVTYDSPGDIKTVQYPWKLIHGGITMSMHEMLKDGISVTDSQDGKNTVEHSDREMTALANMIADKIEDMDEGIQRGMNLMFWRDGTANPNLVPGVRSFILNTPSSAAVVGGIDQVSNPLWRNRARLGISTASPASATIAKGLSTDFRQLRRYGKGPDTLLAGSDYLDALEAEMRAAGYYTQTGWAKSGTLDMSAADPAFAGLSFEYDPTLDDEGLAKFCFGLDTSNIYPMVIEGENMKKHNPARPEDKYVFYRAVTWAGALVCWRRNTSQVWSIA